ncbi:pyrimidine reductase family protein [Pseudolysinimonas kribbensis]|uniref:dihydrofolate reductase family protein n=1 Tax=Pseudolysinimonas kribbensis TaxID=433641 RepID=UPI0031D5C2C2
MILGRVPADRDELRRRYAAPAADWVRVNLVVSLDGSAAGPDGTSRSLTTGADRRVLGAIRAESDLVLVGAATLRAEPELVPRVTPLAVLSRSGDTGAARLRPGDVVLDRLPELGGRIVCEGGPSVVAQLLDAGLIDEICLTTVPRMVGGVAVAPFGGAVTPSLELQQLLVDDAGVSYARLLCVPRGASSAASQSRIAPSQRSGS